MTLAETVAKYRKAIVAFAGAAVLVVGHLYGADSDLYVTIVSVLTAAGVYAAPNRGVHG